jgi:hypothetical protein
MSFGMWDGELEELGSGGETSGLIELRNQVFRKQKGTRFDADIMRGSCDLIRGLTYLSTNLNLHLGGSSVLTIRSVMFGGFLLGVFLCAAL